MSPPLSSDILAPRELCALMAAVAAAALSYGIVMPLLPALLERSSVEAGRSISEHVGLLGGVYMLALFAGAPACGWLSDRLGRRPVILVGLAVVAVALVVLAFAVSLPAIYAGQILAGAAAAAVTPASMAYVADTTGARLRPRRFGAMGVAVALGLLLGPALGSALIGANLSVDRSLGGAAAPFLVALVLTVGTWFGAFAALVEPGQRRIPVADTVAPGERRPATSLLFLVMLATFGLGTFEVAVTLRSQQILLLSPSMIAGTFVVCGLIMLAAQTLVFAPKFDLIVDRRTIAPAFLVMTAGLVLLARAAGPVALAAYVGMVAAAYAVLTIVLTYHVSLAGGGSHGNTFGQQTAMGSLGQASGSASAGFLFGGFPEAPFWIGAGILLLGAVLARVLSSRPGPASG